MPGACRVALCTGFNIGRFLRGVNATFNIALASKRLDAALALVNLQTVINFGTTVSGEIGTNLTYQMADGNVMF